MSIENIRPMEPYDWPRVSEIYRLGLEAGNCTFERTCPSYEHWDKAHLQVGRLVYELDGKILGWIVLSPTSARACYRGVVELSIYIDPAYQRRGIGKALMAVLEQKCREEGFWTLHSTVFANNPASLALHEACGFRKIGYRERIAQDRFDKWQDTIWLEKRL